MASDTGSNVSPGGETSPESCLPPLAEFVGIRIVREAREFFEDMHIGVRNVKILSENVSVLWCTHDWLRYLLGILTLSMKYGDCSSARNWNEIIEPWGSIIQITVDLIINYSLPEGEIQEHRPSRAYSRPVSFTNMFTEAYYPPNEKIEDGRLFQSYGRYDPGPSWHTPLHHYRPFEHWVQEVRGMINNSSTRRQLQFQRSHGVDAAEFREFNEDLEKEIRILISHLMPAEIEFFEDALYKVYLIGLDYSNIKNGLQTAFERLRFCHVMRAKWPLSDPEAEREINRIFRERAQEAFEEVITMIQSGCDGELRKFTAQDVFDTIAWGADIHGKVDDCEDVSLWAAARARCSLDIFRALIDSGAPYRTKPEDNSSPLHAAAKSNNADVARFLLKGKLHPFRIEVNSRDDRERTAVHWAAEEGSLDVLQLLLRYKGVEVDAQDYMGMTPLLLAVQGDMHQGPSCSSRSEYRKQQWKNRYPVIRRLIRDKRVNLSHATQRGMKILHFAAQRKDATLSIVIDQVRCDSNLKNDFPENTPLHLAVEANSGPNVDLLLQHGADPLIFNRLGQTPLIMAIEKRNLGPMKKLLRHPLGLMAQYRNDSSESSTYGRNPVLHVLQFLAGDSERAYHHAYLALEVILGAKPDLEGRDSKGRSVLNSAIKTINEDMLNALLRAGADVNSRDMNGKSALRRGIKSINKEMLLKLLERCAYACTTPQRQRQR